jgi:hypothetical protein
LRTRPARPPTALLISPSTRPRGACDKKNHTAALCAHFCGSRARPCPLPLPHLDLCRADAKHSAALPLFMLFVWHTQRHTRTLPLCLSHTQKKPSCAAWQIARAARDAPPPTCTDTRTHTRVHTH